MRTVIIFMILDLVDVSVTPKTNYFSFLRPPKEPRKIKIVVQTGYCWKSQNVGTYFVEDVENACQQILTPSFIFGVS